MTEYQATVLYKPDTEELRHLPEGPQLVNEDTISWVGIQHGVDSRIGSLNLLRRTRSDWSEVENKSITLPGRPGFAFPTADSDKFIVGLEKHLGVFSHSHDSFTPLTEELEQGVAGTIINDGEVFDGGVVFGAKDTGFENAKAGLYVWTAADNRCTKIRGDQVCSNGKVISQTEDTLQVLDIDTPTKTVARFSIDLNTHDASDREVVLDLNSRSDFPDGMVATPDGRSVIIAFYNPDEVAFGVAEQFCLETGEIQNTWRTPNSPRVTCPLLLPTENSVKLVLTTADEGLTDARRAVHTDAGTLFIGETDFESVSAPVRLTL